MHYMKQERERVRENFQESAWEVNFWTVASSFVFTPKQRIVPWLEPKMTKEAQLASPHEWSRRVRERPFTCTTVVPVASTRLTNEPHGRHRNKTSMYMTSFVPNACEKRYFFAGLGVGSFELCLAFVLRKWKMRKKTRFAQNFISKENRTSKKTEVFVAFPRFSTINDKLWYVYNQSFECVSWHSIPFQIVFTLHSSSCYFLPSIMHFSPLTYHVHHFTSWLDKLRIAHGILPMPAIP